MSLGVPSYGGKESQMQQVPHMLPLTLPARRATRKAHTQLSTEKAVESQLWSSEEKSSSKMQVVLHMGKSQASEVWAERSPWSS